MKNKFKKGDEIKAVRELEGLSLTYGKIYEVIESTQFGPRIINDRGERDTYNPIRFDLVEEFTIDQLKEKIQQVKQTIDDVKNFKNLVKGSRLTIGPDEYLVTFTGHHCLVNIKDGNWFSAEDKTLQDIRDTVKGWKYGQFILVGDPLISDLEKELRELTDKLEELSKPKDLVCSDAPDGWYVINGKTFGGVWMNQGIQKGDILFIKDGVVFMKDHGRFENHHLQHDHCIKGINKDYWNGYTVTKLP